MIPVRISSADQQEILHLLCRVHQLEIQSLEGQSASLLRDFQIRHKDMVITKLHHSRNLSDDIIKCQKKIIDGTVFHVFYILYVLESVDNETLASC